MGGYHVAWKISLASPTPHSSWVKVTVTHKGANGQVFNTLKIFHDHYKTIHIHIYQCSKNNFPNSIAGSCHTDL